MITLLITLVVVLIVAYIAYLAINFIVAKMGLPAEIRTILFLILGLVLLLWILQFFGFNTGFNFR